MRLNPTATVNCSHRLPCHSICVNTHSHARAVRGVQVDTSVCERDHWLFHFFFFLFFFLPKLISLDASWCAQRRRAERTKSKYENVEEIPIVACAKCLWRRSEECREKEKESERGDAEVRQGKYRHWLRVRMYIYLSSHSTDTRSTIDCGLAHSSLAPFLLCTFAIVAIPYVSCTHIGIVTTNTHMNGSTVGSSEHDPATVSAIVASSSTHSG